MTGFVIIDVETHSLADLKKVGAWRYASDSSTDVWCVGYAINDEPVQLWKPNDPDVHHGAITAAAADPDTVFVAHNAGFERAICQHILVPRYGWPAIPLERWRCTMAAALALALPAKLAKITAALGLPAKADDDIMHRMAKPRPPRGDEDRNSGPYWHDDAEHRERLYAYC